MPDTTTPANLPRPTIPAAPTQSPSPAPERPEHATAAVPRPRMNADVAPETNTGEPESLGVTTAPAGTSECHPTGDASVIGTERVLELRVRNHPGTMSHITGLFARRAFNLEAILCVPLADAATSRMLLLVSDEPRLEQVERQLANLHDVLEITHRTDLTGDYFTRIAGP